MSLILDALRKLDREKSFRRDRVANIAVEILRPDLPRRRKRIPLYFAAVLATAIATAAITYSVTVKSSFLSKSSPPHAVNPSVSREVVSPVPTELGSLPKSLPPAAMNPPSPTPRISPSSPPPEPVRATQEKITRVAPKTESQTETTTLVDEAKTSQETISEEKDVVPVTTKEPTERTPVAPVLTPLSLRVSGIVWSEDPSKRFAVINGTAMSEGSVIGEVKVVEIHPTRVQFSHNDRSFEIPLGSSAVIKD